VRALFVARHAPTAADGLCAGRLDLPTTLPTAAAAERLLRERRRLVHVREVWTSPLRRCAELATAVAACLDVPMRMDPRLLEISYGSWEGRPWSDIERDDAAALREWMVSWETLGPPGGESAHDVETRVSRWLAELEPDHDHLLIAHAGVVRALGVLVEARTWPEVMSSPVAHLEFLEYPLARGAPARR
jgi:alpha-ribazole phosphatase